MWGGVPYTWHDNSPAKCDAEFWGSVEAPWGALKGLYFNGGYTTRTTVPITSECITIESTSNSAGIGEMVALYTSVDGRLDQNVLAARLGADLTFVSMRNDIVASHPNHNAACCHAIVIQKQSISAFMNGVMYSQRAGTLLIPQNITVYGGMNGVIMYGIRIYNRALTQEELAHNYELDKRRYGV